MNKKRRTLFRDIFLLLLSCALAFGIVEGGWIEVLLHEFKGARFLGSLMGGLLFTSVFTTVPAVVFLGEIAQENSLITTAFIGAIGALIGDFLIFRFVKNSVSADLAYVYKRLCRHNRWNRWVAFIFHRHFFKLSIWRWVVPLAGAFIIASPLPDELGLAVLGLSKIKTTTMIPLTFVFNFIGILAIGLIARAV